MPNNRRQHKRSVPKLNARSPRLRAQSAPESHTAASRAHTAHSVKDLLARSVPVLSRAADQTARQAFWRDWLQARLPPELAPKITAITERNGILVVFADSPAWSARLRYALQELRPEMQKAQPDIKEVTVRVLPVTAK